MHCTGGQMWKADDLGLLWPAVAPNWYCLHTYRLIVLPVTQYRVTLSLFLVPPGNNWHCLQVRSPRLILHGVVVVHITEVYIL